MLQETKIGRDVCRTRSAEQSPLGARPENAVSRQRHVPEEINPLGEFAKNDFPGMKGEAPVLPEPVLDLRNECPELIRILMEDEHIIRIAKVVANAQTIFHEMVKCVQVHV